MYEISRYCVDLYEVQEKTGDAIARAGAIGSGDMTLEAAYAKIMFLLSQGVDAADFGTWMRRNIAGEISPSSM